jgi:hypothetical protein
LLANDSEGRHEEAACDLSPQPQHDEAMLRLVELVANLSLDLADDYVYSLALPAGPCGSTKEAGEEC